MAGSAVAKGCGGTGERYLFILKRMSNAVNLRLANAIANKKGRVPPSPKAMAGQGNALSFAYFSFTGKAGGKKKKLSPEKETAFFCFTFLSLGKLVEKRKKLSPRKGNSFLLLTFLSLGKKSKLFPFNSARGLLGNIINNTIYAVNFIDNAGGHCIKQFPGQPDNLSSDRVNAVD